MRDPIFPADEWGRAVEVTEKIEELVATVDGVAAVYARRLDREEALLVGAVDERFPTGSAAKLLVLLAFARRVANGDLDPDTVATDLLLDALGGPDEVNSAAEALGVAEAEITSPTVWVFPPGQFGMASPRGLAEAWTQLHTPGPVAELCRSITWRHQLREGFGRSVPFQPDLPDFGLRSKLGLWSKGGSYPTVSCEAGLFETPTAAWILGVMCRELTDTRNSSEATGPTLRALVSRAVYDAWSS